MESRTFLGAASETQLPLGPRPSLLLLLNQLETLTIRKATLNLSCSDTRKILATLGKGSSTQNEDREAIERNQNKNTCDSE